MAIPIFLFLALLGPFDWIEVGPERGSVTAIAAGNETIAGTAQGRLFRWNGSAWKSSEDYGAPIHQITVARDTEWVLAGTDLRRSGAIVARGVTSFAVAPSNGSVIYAATPAAILVSIDGGDRWTTRSGGAESIAVDAVDPQAIWIVRADGDVERSVDGALSWSPAAIPAAIDRIEAHPRRGGTAFVIGADGTGFRTTDAISWSELYYLTGRLVFDPQRDDHFYAIDAEGRLFHSDDDGEWLDTIHGGPILSLAVAADGSLAAGFVDEGVQRSDDGGHTWIPQREGLVAAEIHTLAATADASVIYAGTSRTMHRSNDGGETWSPVFLLRLLPGPFSAIAIDPADPRRLWIAAGISAWYSADGGAHFNRLFWLPANEPQVVTGLAFDPADRRSVFIAMSRSFFRLDSEPLRLTELTPPHVAGDRFDVLSVDPDGGLWIGGSRNDQALLLHSADGGRIWSDVSDSITGGGITALHFDRRLNAMFAGTAGGSVLRSEGPSVWNVSAHFAGAVRSIAADGEQLLAASAAGVYASRDGESWHRVTRSLAPHVVTSMTSSSPLLAGTEGGGVFLQRRTKGRTRAAGR